LKLDHIDVLGFKIGTNAEIVFHFSGVRMQIVLEIRSGIGNRPVFGTPVACFFIIPGT
jgi:hypothetical protein